MIMLRTERKEKAKAKKMVAAGGAVGIPLAAVLIGLSLVLLSLRKTRVNVGLELKRED